MERKNFGLIASLNMKTTSPFPRMDIKNSEKRRCRHFPTPPGDELWVALHGLRKHATMSQGNSQDEPENTRYLSLSDSGPHFPVENAPETAPGM